MLTSQFSGSGEAFQTSFPQTSRKRCFKSQAALDESMSGKSMNSVNEVQDKGNSMINTESKQPPVLGVPQYCLNMGPFLILCQCTTHLCCQIKLAMIWGFLPSRCPAMMADTDIDIQSGAKDL
jgi:hypothetical protein